MNNLSKRPSRKLAVSIVPSDKRIQEKQAELLKRFRDENRNLKKGISNLQDENHELKKEINNLTQRLRDFMSSNMEDL